MEYTPALLPPTIVKSPALWMAREEQWGDKGFDVDPITNFDIVSESTQSSGTGRFRRLLDSLLYVRIGFIVIECT